METPVFSGRRGRPLRKGRRPHRLRAAASDVISGRKARKASRRRLTGAWASVCSVAAGATRPACAPGAVPAPLACPPVPAPPFAPRLSARGFGVCAGRRPARWARPVLVPLPAGPSRRWPRRTRRSCSPLSEAQEPEKGGWRGWLCPCPPARLPRRPSSCLRGLSGMSVGWRGGGGAFLGCACPTGRSVGETQASSPPSTAAPPRCCRGNRGYLCLSFLL